MNLVLYTPSDASAPTVQEYFSFCSLSYSIRLNPDYLRGDFRGLNLYSRQLCIPANKKGSELKTADSITDDDDDGCNELVAELAGCIATLWALNFLTSRIIKFLLHYLEPLEYKPLLMNLLEVHMQ